MELGSIDRNILRVLQEKGRISYVDLSKSVGLSVTPCKDRVRRLEREGFITGYHASVAPGKLDAGLAVFVQIRLSRKSQDIFTKFKEAAMTLSEIQECFLVSGNFDYLIKARVADMGAYRMLLGETLLSLPGVQESSSFVVMEEIKESLRVEIPY
ncbi:MAG: Lrp/AsnC ligand binding domain-containing protein [Pseudomonadota bacterium]